MECLHLGSKWKLLCFHFPKYWQGYWGGNTIHIWCLLSTARNSSLTSWTSVWWWKALSLSTAPQDDHRVVVVTTLSNLGSFLLTGMLSAYRISRRLNFMEVEQFGDIQFRTKAPWWAANSAHLLLHQCSHTTGACIASHGVSFKLGRTPWAKGTFEIVEEKSITDYKLWLLYATSGF